MVSSYKQGFTLVELSIVIIIIGFLIAGIAGGQSLIKSSGLTSIISDVQTIQSATRAFERTYGALPGDITNATAFFGTTDKNGFAVNNGNGDGCIGATNCDDAWDATTTEALAAPQELALAGLIGGTYTGQTDNNSISRLTPGLNIIASKVVGLGYYFAASHYWAIYYPRVINDLGISKPISVEDSYFIDQKIDDGKPFTGKALGLNLVCGSSTANCSIANECNAPSVDKTVPYQLGNGSQCNMQFQVDDNYVPTH